MVAETHKLVAQKVYEVIKDIYNFEINIKSLKRGCVVPDIKIPGTFTSHRKERSRDFFIRKVDRLSNNEFEFVKRDIKAFSYRLGVIIHFITDYFCKYHNFPRQETTIKTHLQYEKRLNNFAKNVFSSFKNIEIDLSIKDQRIHEYIDGLHMTYMNLKDSMKKDISFAIQACVNFALCMFDSCFSGSFAKGRRQLALAAL